ncbi:CoA pyrophosphatase [Clostridium sp. Sa3CUN1]|uniref:CoA pyrophosphatase n=1 Tax=Clostridium gallinarum TaxID=2762246 RepID=A0ABR8Q4N3_9CLOT|nr:CoA pyrophosphatase [Clostridium gallinarum]MBD7915359.1 CoA pyrophosphatase [Clostridium gallinarum]
MIEDVLKVFENYTPYINGWENMKRASVAILMVDMENKTNIIFQVRSLHMRNQPGDISLPGGKIEEYESPIEAVEREVCEELGLIRDDFEIVEALDLLVTHYGLIIHPFLGYIKNINNIKINEDEVDHIFTVPIEELIDKKPLEIISEINVNRNENFPYNLINGGENYKFKTGLYKSLFFKYKEYTIWGMTALIIENFLSLLNNNK